MIAQCRLCASRKLTSAGVSKGVSLVRCAACGLVQISEPLAEYDVGKIYDEKYYSKSRYRTNVAANFENKRRMTLLRQALSRASGRVLDVGCGTGEFLASLSNQMERWGCDIAGSAIEIAVNRAELTSAKLFCGVVEQLPLTAQYFDVITLWDVIEHLESPITTLEHCRKLLKPDGSILISTPNIGTLSARILGKRWAFMTPPEHVSFFDKGTLKLLLEKNNLVMCTWQTKGKWVDAKFLMYKFRQMWSSEVALSPSRVESLIPCLPLYVPTGDIQYARAVQKSSSS